MRVCVVAGLAAFATAGAAQETGRPGPPGSSAAANGSGASMSVGQQPAAAALDRMVSLDLRDVELNVALKEINRQANLGLAYSPRVVPVDRRVTIRGEHLTAGEALRAVLRGTGVEAVVSAAGTVMLVRRARTEERTSSADAPVASLVAGRVRDAATGKPLEYVLVSIVDSTISVSTHTTDSGVYVLRDVPPGEHTVRARLIGFKPAEQTVVVADLRPLELHFELELSGSRLQEVVSTATGARRRLELGSDITVIDADSIVRTQPIASVTDLLEGRVPGMVIQRTSGAPGDPARIRLRGASSPRLSNDPIVVVDGIRVYSEQSGDRGGNLAGAQDADGNYATPSPLDYLDPNSIQTIEVLKGPSAATLYGQDAANGVIVITTKKGRAGPPRWTASAERGMTEMVGSYPDLMLRWGHATADNAVVFCPINDRVGGSAGSPTCLADSVVTFQMLNDPALTVLDQGTRTAVTLGVSGGSQALTYSVTGSFRDEVGLVKLPGYESARYLAEEGGRPPDWMQRPQNLTQWGAASRLTAQIGDRADISLSANLSRTEQQRSELEQQLGSLMSTYLDRSSGTYYVGGAFLGSIEALDATELLTGYQERATAVATQFTNGVNLNWRPLSWLTTTADAGLNVIQRADEIFLPVGFGSSERPDDGRLQLGQGTSVVSTVNLRALAGVPVGRGFRLQLATGVNYSGTSTEDLVGDVRGLSEGTEAPSPGSEILRLNRTRVDGATFGWYIEPSISHRRFWLSTGLRLDGGNTFGTKLSLPAFPKLSLSYLVSDEPFFPFKDLIPVLRVRLAYGQAGRQPGPTDRLRLYGSKTPVLVDDEIVDGVLLEKLGNTELKPERSTEIEGGLDADLFDDRLTLGLTGYQKTTRDAMLAVPLAPSVYGDFVTVLENIGVIRNTGFEASLGAQVLRTDPITWGLQLAVSQQRNEVVRLGAGVEPFYTEGAAGGEGGLRVAAGYPLFGRWTRPILGYADANDDGVLERNEVLLGDTAVFVGGTLPDYTANLSTTVSLMRGMFSVTAAFQYEDGMTQRNEVAQRLSVFSSGWNDSTASLDEQAATMNAATEYNWIQTVSTLRFNSLAVTYNVPSRMAQRVGARALSVSMQGTNLGIHTNYRGLDPNVNARATGNGVTDSGVLPRPRTWQLRVSATY